MPSPGESVADVIEKQLETEQTVAAPVPAPLQGTLPLVNLDSAIDRWFYLGVALVVVAAFFFAVFRQNVPAHSGVDQNGYLVGGKAIAHTGTMKLAPQRPGSSEFDPHQFVGRMYVGADLGTPTERYYPKYPLGYPALIAMALHIGGAKLVYWLNPGAMTLAVLATFLIGRLVANSFVAVLAALAFATSPTTLLLSSNPNSHATAVCVVAWGMYLLLRWWQSGGRVRAIFAGLLIGYAATIRYTEGTLALPIGLAILFNLRWRDRRSRIESALVTLGWLIPVSTLLIYNKCAMGTWTGYDPTNESGGFRWEYAIDNWETMLRQLTTSGLFFLFPLAIAGLIMMFWWHWKLACVFAAWIVPCLVVYTFYYWAPDGSVTGYLRFFETIIPALAVCAMWMLKTLSDLFTASSLSPVLPSVAARPASPPWDRDRTEGDAGVAATADSNVKRAWRYSLVLLIGAAVTALLTCREYSTLPTAIWVGALASILFGAGLLGRKAGMTMMIGLFAGITAAVQAHGTAQPWEFEQYQRLMVMFNEQAVHASAKPGSVIFLADQQLAHHLQFIDDYYLYSGETFNRNYIQNLPNADPPDEPQGLDPGRRDALYKRFKDFSQSQLNDEQKKIINGALDAGQHVYFILPKNPNEPLARILRRDLKGKYPPLPDPVRRFANEFDVQVVTGWTQPLPRPMPENMGKPRGKRMDFRWNVRGDRFMQGYQMVEILKKAPTTQPDIVRAMQSRRAQEMRTTAPSTRPTMRPTSRPAAR